MSSEEAVVFVVRQLNLFEARECFFAIFSNDTETPVSFTRAIDDARSDLVGCGAAGQPATGPVRSATRL